MALTIYKHTLASRGLQRIHSYSSFSLLLSSRFLTSQTPEEDGYRNSSQ